MRQELVCRHLLAHCPVCAKGSRNQRGEPLSLLGAREGFQKRPHFVVCGVVGASEGAIESDLQILKPETDTEIREREAGREGEKKREKERERARASKHLLYYR